MKSIFNNLACKFREIHALGWIKSVNEISSGVGMTFEKLLGKEEDDFSFPDFEGIEIKTQRISSDYPITLFGLAPWGKDFPEIERLRKQYGYYDYSDDDNKKLNVEFYCSKKVLIHNRYFFNLDINYEDQKIYLIIRDIDNNVIDNYAYWSFDDIKEKLNGKLHYLGFIHAFSKKELGNEYFKYFKLECYEIKNLDTFLALVEKNIICVSITTSPVKYGPSMGKNKASCYFRIGKFDLDKLFDLDCIIDFNSESHY